MSNASVHPALRRESFEHQRHVLQDAVVELGSSTRDDESTLVYEHGGTMTFARSELQVTRLHEEIASARDIGIGPDDLSWVDETDLDGHVVLRALVERCSHRTVPASIPPDSSAASVTSFARLGAMIFENTAVTRIIPRRGDRRAEVSRSGQRAR